MNQTPEQEAQELAEKCAEVLLDCEEIYQHSGNFAKWAFRDTILQQLNLTDLIRKAREVLKQSEQIEAASDALTIAGIINQNADWSYGLNERVQRLAQERDQIKQQNAELMKDKEMLYFIRDLGDFQFIYKEGRPEVAIPVIRLCPRNFKDDFADKTFFEAITAAMAKQEGK